jgi:hypothetical protein
LIGHRTEQEQETKPVKKGNLYNKNNRKENMKLKIFQEGREQAQEPKPVYLRLVLQSFGICLAACDSEGKTITHLLSFFDTDKIYTVDGAYAKLKKKGYDTSFCDWRTTGSVVINE